MNDSGAELGDDSSDMLTGSRAGMVREGAFDAQLSFETPFVEAPRPIASIIKRDGREVPFDKNKIAEAIFRAARSIGGEDRDRADSLASGVAIYLSKRLQGAVPSVDHVHDAVEKVLIEMGHAKTALAYARYRDRRARIRKLRGGDVRAVLRELEEARRETEDFEQTGAHALFVRTSDERLDGWDRERIVAALTRETGMAEGLARVIALEVEGQIARAHVETLTASLVRELVDARLVEHGLEEYRRKHMRLGVPLFDAERIVCAPNQGESESIYDPSRTDVDLAERVKKEYALTQVFSRGISDAHLRGDLHIHDLGRVDRLHGAHHSLEFIKHFGLPFAAGDRYAPLPLNAEMLIAQTTQFTAALHRHFTREAVWDGFNLLLAPFLASSDARQLRQLAHMLLFGLARMVRHHCHPLSCTGVSLVWAPSAALASKEAIGPGGLPTGRAYADYLPDARRFAWELLEAFKESRAHHGSEQDWAPLIHVSDDFFAAPGHGEFLTYALNDDVLRSRLRFVFERDSDPGGQSPAWRASRVTVQEISLNLPRAAYRAKCLEKFFQEIEKTVAVAVKAHAEKGQFIHRLLAFRDVGPLSMLTYSHDGKAYFDSDSGIYRIGVVGLNEAVRVLAGECLNHSPESLEAGMRILQHVRECAVSAGAAEHMNVEVAATEDVEVLRRFASMDLAQFPGEARRVMRPDPLTQDVRYTPGICCEGDTVNTPIDRARVEGAFHALLDVGPETRVFLGAGDYDPESIAQFIEKVYYRTRVRRMALAPASAPV